MTEEDENKGCKGHQHYCCIECGSTEQVGLMGGATVCRKCLEKTRKKLGTDSILFDELFFLEYSQKLGYAKKMVEAEKEKDKSTG